MKAVACHDVGLATQNSACGAFLHVHQLKEAELSFFVIEEQIDIGIITSLVPRGGAEQVEVLDAVPFSTRLRGL